MIKIFIKIRSIITFISEETMRVGGSGEVKEDILSACGAVSAILGRIGEEEDLEIVNRILDVLSVFDGIIENIKDDTENRMLYLLLITHVSDIRFLFLSRTEQEEILSEFKVFDTVYTAKMKRAIKFSTKTHEVYQKQKRKGKDIPYIVHPLTVGIILARADASEDVVVAGILHDTIEDSIPEEKVTQEMLTERFGKDVADLVVSVTEENKSAPWDERKAEALEHIKDFSQESVLIKSADVISNMSELLDDYEQEGESIWEHFSAPKDKLLQNAECVISALIDQWPESPLGSDLREIRSSLDKIVLSS